MSKPVRVEEHVLEELQEIRRKAQWKENRDYTLSDIIYECLVAYKEREAESKNKEMARNKAIKKKKN